MNDMHAQNDPAIETMPPVPTAPEDRTTPATTETKQPRTWIRHALFAVLIFLVGLGLGSAAILFYENGTPDQSATSLRQADKTRTNESELPAIAKEDGDITDEPASAADWQTYKDSSGQYSFRYPKAWSLTREVEHNPYNAKDTTEYEKISLKHGDKEVVAFNYPFEMEGCGPSTTTEPYEFGKYSATMIDPCGGMPEMAGKQFMIMFDNPRPRPSNLSQKEWPMLRLVYTPVSGSQQDFVAFAKSIDGLVPAQGYRK